jgi:hypothetical protein
MSIIDPPHSHPQPACEVDPVKVSETLPPHIIAVNLAPPSPAHKKKEGEKNQLWGFGFTNAAVFAKSSHQLRRTS